MSTEGLQEQAEDLSAPTKSTARLAGGGDVATYGVIPCTTGERKKVSIMARMAKRWKRMPKTKSVLACLFATRRRIAAKRQYKEVI